MKEKQSKVFKKYKTAVITGASSGIGLEFAHRFAKMHINLVLIARRANKLEEICSELSNRYKIKASYIVSDLSLDENVRKSIDQLKKFELIDILVNGAGFGTLGEFSEVPIEMHFQMINLHINAAVRLCHAVLPSMQKRNQGIIINVASVGAFIPGRGNAIYGATKSFLITFTENLQSELVGSGILLQALCPGFTRTEFHSVGHFSSFDSSIIPKWLWMTRKEVVDYSISSLPKKRLIAIPGRKNRWIVKMSKSVFVQAYLKVKQKKSEEVK